MELHKVQHCNHGEIDGFIHGTSWIISQSAHVYKAHSFVKFMWSVQSYSENTQLPLRVGVLESSRSFVLQTYLGYGDMPRALMHSRTKISQICAIRWQRSAHLRWSTRICVFCRTNCSSLILIPDSMRVTGGGPRSRWSVFKIEALIWVSLWRALKFQLFS